MNENEPFLKRWARLKGGQKAGETAPAEDGASPPAQRGAENPGDQGQRTGSALEVAPPPTPPPAPGATQPAEHEEPFDLTTLPRVEDVRADTDITGFLDRRVPAALRNAALRQMWSADPAIRDFIEVAENQGNWNIPGEIYGYGPLEPGTDIAALLAQATGAITKVLAPAEGEATIASLGGVRENLIVDSSTAIEVQHSALRMPDTPPTEYAASQQPLQPPRSSLEVASRIGAEPLGRADDGAVQQGDDIEAEPMRRRHGGALPS